MQEIHARTTGGLKVEVTDGRHVTVLDEPLDQGGSDLGPKPTDALLAALAGCTAITLKLYSQRKEWPLDDVKVRITMERPAKGEGGAVAHIVQHVELLGPLDAEQRERLQQIAGRCPVHRIMEGPVHFEERLVDPADAGV